mgnify:CR=1
MHEKKVVIYSCGAIRSLCRFKALTSTQKPTEPARVLESSIDYVDRVFDVLLPCYSGRRTVRGARPIVVPAGGGFRVLHAFRAIIRHVRHAIKFD